MDRHEFTRIEEEIDRNGRIDEGKAQRLVAVAQGADVTQGGVEPGEALDLLVRAYVGRAIDVINKVGRLPYGVGFDEAKCLDRMAAAIREAAADFDPAKGSFAKRCDFFLWRVAHRAAKRARRSSPSFVSISPPSDDELAAMDLDDPDDWDTLADPRAERAQERLDARIAIEEWARRTRGSLALAHSLRASRRRAPRERVPGRRDGRV